MADIKPLVISSGRIRQIPDGDQLISGVGIQRQTTGAPGTVNLFTDTNTTTVSASRTGQLVNVLGSLTVAENLTANGLAVTFISGEAISSGQCVSLTDNVGAPNIFLADANGAGTLSNAIGIAIDSDAGGGSVRVVISGNASVPDAYWDTVPSTTDVGKIVYMSTTAGNLTITAPSTAGETVQRIGYLSRGGAGNSRVIVLNGDGVVL